MPQPLAPLALLAKTEIAAASPKSSLSSLFRKAAAPAAADGGGGGSEEDDEEDGGVFSAAAALSQSLTPDDTPPAHCAASDDPTVSFRIRNYSAVDDAELDALEQSAAAHPAMPLPIRINSSSSTISNASTVTHTTVGQRVAPEKVGVEHFERLKVIGQGGYGKVFLVRKKATQTIYAMKVLKKATLVIHTKTVEHTKNERTILSQLTHPFIVKLHYAFQTPEKLYLILQYAPGGELFSHLATQRMFDEDTASFYIGELLLALEHLHGLGIIYRDLKPENVLLDAKGHVLLTDFGLSKVALETRTVCGTIEFTAPEVLDNQTEYGPGVDYWSLGVMLFDMLTGRPPFSGNNRKKVMELILKGKVTFPPYLTSYAKDLLNKLLKKNPAQRLGSNGAQEVKSHSYFRKLNWKQLAARELEPPICPSVVGSLDTSNFDECFTGMSIESPPLKTGGLHPFNPAYIPASATVGGAASLAPPTTNTATTATAASNTNTSTPTPMTPATNKKKKHRKKAEAAAAAAAAVAASSASNSPASVKGVLVQTTAPGTPTLESTSSEISLEINDVPTPLTSIAIPGSSGMGRGGGGAGLDSSASESGSLVVNHFHGFSYVADDGFFGMDG
ncbi:kinase-like domain-containing protein [Obelidium mucronatum]|nr:kinase-like domain-containing protein [Obelidium mucronatum]